MAVQPRELEWFEGKPEAPPLRLVPPRRRGRPGPAILFLLLLAGLLGIPVAQAVVEGTPPPLKWHHRPRPAAQIASLDPVSAMPRRSLPTSRHPVPGVLFVSCTHLWRAWPDGSHRMLVLERPGIISPTMSPTGHTIAFLSTGPDGPELWMTAADGSETVLVGTIGGDAVPAAYGATGLTWSPGGAHLALAVTTPGESPWTGGAAIFDLDIKTGEFEKVTSGWPQPVWAGRRLGTSEWVEDKGPQFSFDKNRYIGRQMSSENADLTAGLAPAGLDSWWDKTAAILRRADDGDLELAVKSRYYRKGETVAAPAGHAFFEDGRPAVSDDGAKLFVDLLDGTGERDLGIYDTSNGDWTVLDYAWSPATSPVPTTSGPPDARRASDAADDVLRTWNSDPRRISLLIGGSRDEDLLPFKRVNHILGTASKDGGDWVVPAVAYGRTKNGHAYRHVSVRVHKRGTRLLATPHSTSEVVAVKTVADAARALDEMLDVEIVAPTWLPAGAKLSRHPFYAYRWRNYESGSIHLRVPTPDAKQKWGYMSITYGREVSLQLGCGGINDPESYDLGGTSAMTDHLGRTRAIVWPATEADTDHGNFSVSGDVPREAVIGVATSMEASR